MAAQGSSPRASFPRTRRLLKHADFDRVYRQGRRQFADHVTVFYLWREDSAGARVGFTVGKALGGAVQRNRIRRRLREAVRLSLPGLNAAVDVVLNPKKSALTADFADLGAEVARAFERISAETTRRQVNLRATKQD
jgi:ribonuclease P protein component